MTVPVRRLCALALTALVWTAGNAPGQSRPTVELLVSAGFANHLRAPWGPVTVTARNLGGDAVRGELVFEARDTGDGFRSRRDVFLGPSSTKRITFYIPASWGTVRFLVDGKPVTEVEVRGERSADWVNELLVVVSRRLGVLSFLEQTSTGGPGGSPGTTRKVAQVSNPASLPDRWAGYSGVTAVVLDDFEFSRLSGPQQRALLGWVETGGWLIISPGADARPLLEPPWDDLLGLELTGSQEAREAPELERLYGAFEGEGTFLLHRFGAKRFLLKGVSVDGWPSYIGVQTGAGVVVVTAFDVGGFPFRGWSGAPAFWQALLNGLKRGPRPGWRRAAETTYYSGQTSPQRSALQVLSAMTAKAAPVLLIVGLVGLYVLCVGPVNYLFLRDYRRRVWLVVTTPLVALVFVVVVGSVGVLGRGFNALTLHMTFLTVCGDGESAYQRSYVGVWCPTSGSFDLESGADYFVQPLVAGRQPVRWERIGATVFAERNLLEDCSFRVRELRCFQVDAVRPLGGRLILHREGKGLVLENDTDLNLRGAYAETGGQTILFGDLAAGESERGRVQASSGGSRSRTEWLRSVAPEWVPETGAQVPRLLTDIEDDVTGMVVRSAAGPVYRIEAAVGNLEEPVRLREGRARSHRELALLRAYLVAE